MILVLNFDNNPIYHFGDGIISCDFNIYPELIYEIGYAISELSDENVDDKSRLIFDLKDKEIILFNDILNQVDRLIEKLISKSPTGNFEIQFSPQYIDWLRYNVNHAYHSIAESLDAKGGKIYVVVDDLYDQIISDNVIRKAKQIISEYEDIDILFVSGLKTDSDSLYIHEITSLSKRLKLVDCNYVPMLWKLAKGLEKNGNIDEAITFYKKIDTYDSWMHVIESQLLRESDDINNTIQLALLKTLDERQSYVLKNLSKAIGVKKANNLNTFTQEFLSWKSDENYKYNLLYYIAEKRFADENESIVWYKNSGDEGIIKASQIYMDKAKKMIDQFKSNPTDIDLELDAHHTLNSSYDLISNLNSQHDENKFLIYSQFELGVIQLNCIQLKEQGIKEFLEHYNKFYKSEEDLLEYFNKQFNSCIDTAKIAMSKGASTADIENIMSDIKVTRSEFDKIAANYIRKLEKKQKEEYAKVKLVQQKLEAQLEWLPIRGGEFSMGVGSNDPLAHEHSVTISPFKVFTSNIEKIICILFQNPNYNGSDRYTWNEYQTFINKLNEICGESYSLISEAQYEYLVKYLADKSNNNYGRDLHEIEKAHLFGVLCLDDYSEHSFTAQTDPVISLGTPIKVVRNKMKRSSADVNERCYKCLVVSPLSNEDLQELRKEDETKAFLKYQEEEKKLQNELQREKERKELLNHKNAVLNHLDFLIENRGKDFSYKEEVSLATELKTHCRAVGDKNWTEEEKRIVDGVVGYYGLRGIVFNRDFSRGIGTNNWLRRENAKLKGYCCAFGIGRNISYQAALDFIHKGKKAKLIESQSERDRIEELIKLSKSSDRKLKQMRLSYMLETSEKFMNGDESSNIYKNKRFAFLIIEKAAEEGSTEATKRLLKCYMDEIGTKRDDSKIRELQVIFEKNVVKTDPNDNESRHKVGFFSRLFGKKNKDSTL